MYSIIFVIYPMLISQMQPLKMTRYTGKFVGVELHIFSTDYAIWHTKRKCRITMISQRKGGCLKTVKVTRIRFIPLYVFITWHRDTQNCTILPKAHTIFYTIPFSMVHTQSYNYSIISKNIFYIPFFQCYTNYITILTMILSIIL